MFWFPRETKRTDKLGLVIPDWQQVGGHSSQRKIVSCCICSAVKLASQSFLIKKEISDIDTQQTHSGADTWWPCSSLLCCFKLRSVATQQSSPLYPGSRCLCEQTALTRDLGNWAGCIWTSDTVRCLLDKIPNCWYLWSIWKKSLGEGA